jgi:hypothetical protein
MHLPAGIAVIVATSAALLVTALRLRPRLPALPVNALLVLEGALLGVGGLLVQTGVGPASWVVAPLFLGIVTVLHVRFLFGGAGPFRT